MTTFEASIIFKAAGAVSKIGSSLKPNHHLRFYFAQICETLCSCFKARSWFLHSTYPHSSFSPLPLFCVIKEKRLSLSCLSVHLSDRCVCPTVFMSVCVLATPYGIVLPLVLFSFTPLSFTHWLRRLHGNQEAYSRKFFPFLFSRRFYLHHHYQNSFTLFVVTHTHTHTHTHIHTNTHTQARINH